MSWDSVKGQVSGVFQGAVVDWVKASVPKPPGAVTVQAPAAQQAQQVQVIAGGIDKKYLILGAAALGVVALFLILGKKGK